MPSTILPSRRDGRDVGWRWWKGANMNHWLRSRPESTLAISHCGMVVEKSTMAIMDKLPLCPYCLSIERMRDNIEKSDGTSVNFSPSDFTTAQMKQDYGQFVRQTRFEKGKG